MSNASTFLPQLNKISEIAMLIGSPFNNTGDFSQITFNINDLFELSTKNKIGLFFLESLSSKNIIGHLQDELIKLREIRRIQSITASRAAMILNDVGCNYAIAKSNYIFPSTPNDVDLLILGTGHEYFKAIDAMKAAHFKLVGEEAPLEVCLHDSSRSMHFDDTSKRFPSKDPYDVDIYKEVGAGHIIYMNKSKLEKYVTETTIFGNKAKVLQQPAEIALSIFHAIYPERIYTLLLHFHILYGLKAMTRADINEFIRISNDHRMNYAVRCILSIAEYVQEICFGHSLRELTELREAFGKRIILKINQVPYLLPMKLLLRCFWCKRNDLTFSFSFAKQFISMLNLSYIKYVLAVYEDRRRRDTY
jgi:hypothetical protein